MRAAVGLTTCIGLIRFHLSGFKGYPNSEPGERTFGRHLSGCAVSVGHAEAILEAFTQEFPTVQELRDAAANLRKKFQPAEDPRVKWEREYGKPDTGWSQALLNQPHQVGLRVVLWQSIRDSLYYTSGAGQASDFWGGALQHHRKEHAASHDYVWSQIVEQGWQPLMSATADEMIELSKGMPYQPPQYRAPGAMPVSVITQADIERAEREVREQRAQGEMDGVES
jgi:hypothetical protein